MENAKFFVLILALGIPLALVRIQLNHIEKLLTPADHSQQSLIETVPDPQDKILDAAYKRCMYQFKDDAYGCSYAIYHAFPHS